MIDSPSSSSPPARARNSQQVPTDPPGPLLEQQIAPCFGSETNVEAGDSLGLSDLRCLFELGVENPGELARLLEEEDPLNVSCSPTYFTVIRVCEAATWLVV